MDDPKILIVDPEIEEAKATAQVLADLGYSIEVCKTSEDAIHALSDEAIGLVISHVGIQEGESVELLETASDAAPPVGVIFVAEAGSVATAVEAMALGALGYMTRPVDPRELQVTVQRAMERAVLARENVDLKRRLEEHQRFDHIIGRSRPMVEVLRVVRDAARTTATVLIEGENGTGKELIARAIHDASDRRDEPFVALNCAALSESIVESELFGHEKGAFTGASSERTGRFEYADGGTLFLDEIGDMPMATQIKLLRVLEQREITRVGSNEPVPVDIRLITATNRDIEQMVEDGEFRQDLYYRIKVVTIRVPPLRERKGDIPLLVEAFIEEFAERHDKAIEGMTPEARRVLSTYDWPGNVRELRNCIESMIVVTREPLLDVEDIPNHVRQAESSVPRVAALAGHSIEEVEKQLIGETLELTEGNREDAARILGIGERTLYRKIKKYDLRDRGK